MPWCDACTKFQPPAALTETGACPDCETVIGEAPKAPWHFKLLVAAVVAYVGWRLVQMATWLF